MPFAKRIVSPQRIGRLSPEEKKAIEEAGEFLSVSHCAIVGLLQQLTSVTKHADGIFNDLYEDCKQVLARTEGIRKRCDALSETVEKFNHKTEKIPQGDLTKISKNPSHHYHYYCQVDKQLFTNASRPECVQEQYDAAVLDREEVRKIHEEYREKEGDKWELDIKKKSISDLDDKIPNLEIETRKPALIDLLERDKREHESPWIRPQSADMLLFMKDNSNINDLPLPTPEEALRRNAQSQPSVLIPVDVTGTTFNRMCEFRRSLRGSMEYEKRKSRKRRRRTVSGIPGEVSKELDDMGFGLSPNGPSTIERSKTLDFEACRGGSTSDTSDLDFRISRDNLFSSRDDVFDSPEHEEERRPVVVARLSRAPERPDKNEKHEKKSLRGSFRNLSCLGNRAEARSRQRSTILEREKRSRSLPPDRHKAESGATMQKEKEKPLERTISQETLQSNHQFGLVRCLSFHKLRRSRSMSGNKDRKEKKKELIRAKSQDFDTVNSCDYPTNNKKTITRAKSQDFETVNTTKNKQNNKKFLSRAKSQDFNSINSCGYKSDDDLDQDEGIAVSQDNIVGSGESVGTRERLSPAERLLKKEKRKSLGKRLSQFWSNVQFRPNSNKKRHSKEERNSSSGAWSASSESMRQSTGSGGSGPSPDRSSFKDSALELHAPPPPIEADRASQKGSIHGSLMDVRRNFTTMDSDTWLKQQLEERSKAGKRMDIPVKDLTTANLEAHDLRTLTNDDIVIDEEQSSVYSVDQEGFYTSMHTDSGLSKRHSMHSVLSGASGKEVNEPARYMFQSNVTLDSVIYRPKDEDRTAMVEGKSTDTLTEDTPGYLSMTVVAKGPELAPPPVPPHSKAILNQACESEMKKKPCPLPPKRVSTLNRSNSSVDGMPTVPPMDSFATPLHMPRSLSANSSLNNSKVTLNSTDSEPDPQHIYARVKMKTAINTSMYPSMCSVTPMNSDDETISLRSDSRSDSDFTVSSLATPSPLANNVQSPWSDFKSPYSTINRYKNLMKQKTIVESTPLPAGGYKSHTLPRKMSFKQFALKESEEEKRKRWSAENKSLSSDDSGEHYNSNSWPRSPPFRQKKINVPIVGGSIKESKDEAPAIPPKPLGVKSGSSDSLKSSSSGGRTGSGEIGPMTGKSAMKPIPEIKTFSEYQELLKDVSPENPGEDIMAAESMLSLSSSSSQSTGISSMSSGSASGSEGTVPSKYQHTITVRPKSGDPLKIVSPTDKPRINLMSSVDNLTSKVGFIKVREPIYANTSRGDQRPVYANLNTRQGIYANTLAKTTNVYANVNNSPHIYGNTSTKLGHSNASSIEVNQNTSSNVSPPRPELIYAITNVVKSDATGTRTSERVTPVYATTNLVKTPPSSTHGATDSAADTSSGYIQMSWPENKVEAEVKRVSSFMGPPKSQQNATSDYSSLSSFAAKPDSETKQFRMTEDADKCVVTQESEEASPKSSSNVPKPFQPASFTIGPTVSQNKYATISKGRKLSVDANMMNSVVPSSKAAGNSSGPVISTGALVAMTRRNSSPAITTEYSAPSKKVTVPSTILGEPSSPVEKVGPSAIICDGPVLSRHETNNNSVMSALNKNKACSRSSLDNGLSKSRDSLGSTKSAKGRISLDNISKPKPLNDLDYLKRMKSLSPGDEQEELQKSRDSIDETAVMDILNSIRSTIDSIHNEKNNETTTEQTSPTVVVTKAPNYGTTV